MHIEQLTHIFNEFSVILYSNHIVNDSTHQSMKQFNLEKVQPHFLMNFIQYCKLY